MWSIFTHYLGLPLIVGVLIGLFLGVTISFFAHKQVVRKVAPAERIEWRDKLNDINKLCESIIEENEEYKVKESIIRTTLANSTKQVVID